jgi:hypothetical protein
MGFPIERENGGRLDMANDLYIIVSGGKHEVQQIAEILNRG